MASGITFSKGCMNTICSFVLDNKDNIFKPGSFTDEKIKKIAQSEFDQMKTGATNRERQDESASSRHIANSGVVDNSSVTLAVSKILFRKPTTEDSIASQLRKEFRIPTELIIIREFPTTDSGSTKSSENIIGDDCRKKEDQQRAPEKTNRRENTSPDLKKVMYIG